VKLHGVTDEAIRTVLADGSGISGPGKPVVGDGWRGTRSGRTLFGPITDSLRPELASAKVVTDGKIPRIKPIWDVHMRDAVIILGGDGNYYMTGSTGDNVWKHNTGIELYRSADLQKWDYMGVVWSIEKDGGWEKTWSGYHRKPDPIRAVWAPEIHYIHKNYYICLSMANMGCSILKSTTGKPEGPYIHATSREEPLIGGIDPTLFEDDDGAVYFSKAGGQQLVRMKDDLSGFAEKPRSIQVLDPDIDPALHHRSCKSRNYKDLGFEGVTMFKANGKYYLAGTDLYQGCYTMCVGIADNIYGPYRLRHPSALCNGGTGFFRAKDGSWYSCFFGGDANAPWRERPGIIRMEFDSEGRVMVAKTQPDFILVK